MGFVMFDVKPGSGKETCYDVNRRVIQVIDNAEECMHCNKKARRVVVTHDGNLANIKA